jgi:PAS domain S-box-containing protein
MRRPFAILGVSLGFGLLYWIVDAVYDYFTFADTIRILIFHEPLTLWDALVRNIPRNDLIARLSFLASCLAGGGLVVLFMQRVEHAESVLRENERLSRALFENALAGLYSVDVRGEILSANPAFARMLGCSGNRESGEAVRAAWPGAVADPAAWRDFVRRAVNSSEPVETELEARTAQGRPLWLLHSCRAVEDPGWDHARLECSVVDISHRKVLEDLVRAHSQELVRVQEKERRALALDLHDNMAQDLAALKIAVATLCDGHPEAEAALRPGLERCMDMIGATLDNVRRTMQGLLPSELEHFGLGKVVSAHLAEFREVSSLDVEFSGEEQDGRDLGLETKVHVLRILQESLHNVRRHAQAERVEVRIWEEPGELHLLVGDDGVGFDLAGASVDAARNGRFGLQSMRERASILGGTLEISSAPAQGTVVHLTAPLHRNVPA